LAWGVWIGFDWLRTGTGGGLLWVRWWTFGFLRHGVSYLVSLGTSTSGSSCILHNSREPTTVALYLNVVYYIKLWWNLLKNPQVVEFLDSSPSGMSVHFIKYREDKSGQSGKKSGRFVTLLDIPRISFRIAPYNRQPSITFPVHKSPYVTLR
jgi:hypothetical protein